jgi:WD40 repeat protein
LQQWRLTPFATQAAQAATLHLSPTPLENLDTLLTESGLSPKRQAQQVELDRFLDQIKTALTSALPLNARNAFISYAWEPNAKDLSRQQRHLRQLAHDLGRAGFPTWLDIERMTGDINAQMAQNIQNSRYVLMIGTPRYTQRATVLLNGQPTNVKREYDDILKGHQEGRLNVLALQFLPEGPFDGGKADDTGQTAYPSFPETMPALSRFDLLGIDEVETYLHCLTDEREGLLPQLLHLAERSPADQAAYQAAKAALTERLYLLPAAHLIVTQADQDQRIYEIEDRRKLYIEARARAEANDTSPEVGLTPQFDAFLSMTGEESKDDAPSLAKATTFLALGSGGSGKSLFSQIQYARLLAAWQSHQKDPATHPRPAWIPVYIPLKHYVGKWEATAENQAARRVGQPRVNTCVAEALRQTYHLDEQDIERLKTGSGQGLGVLLILDGYDELGGEKPHLYNLNGLAHWACPLKLLVTSRIDYIPDPEKHRSYFATPGQGDNFVRCYIQPFSAYDIQRYIQLYESQLLIQQSQAQAARDAASGVLASKAASPQTDTYPTLEKLPGLLDLVKNPFLLNLVLQGLPYLVEKCAAHDPRPVTRLAIYDSFSQYWFGKEVFRLVKKEDRDLRLRFEQHAERLAFQLFLNTQLSVSQKRQEDAELWNEFFNAADPQIAQARAALPLRDAGDQQYEFMHKTLLEYFVARHFVNAYDRAIAGQPHPNPVALGEALAARPPKDKARYAGGVPLPVQDAGVFNFLKDAIETGGVERSFKAALFDQVKRSATPEGQAEPETGGPLGLAAAQGATILTKTGISMCNQVWTGAQLPGADLGLASLGNTDLRGANLQGVYLMGTFLHGVNLSCANLKDVRFMEYPKITLQKSVNCLALYPSLTAGQAKPWIVVGQGNEVVLIDQDTRQILGRGKGHERKVTCVAFSPQGDRVVSGSGDYTLRLWEVTSAAGELTPQAVLRGHESWVNACAFSPQGDRVVSGDDKTLRLWTVGEVMHKRKKKFSIQGVYKALHLPSKLSSQAVLRGHESSVSACAFSPQGDRVVSGSHDKTLRLWEVTSASGDLTAQAVLRGHTREVTACAFSPQGDRVVSGSADETLCLWEVTRASGDLTAQAVLRGHTRKVSACAFSPEGGRVISGSYDRTLRLWEVTDPSSDDFAYTVLRGHEGAVTMCAFSPEGDRVVWGSGDKILRIWEVKAPSDKLVSHAMLRGHESHVNACAFSPQGNMVVSGGSGDDSGDITLRLWEVRGSPGDDLVSYAVLRGHESSVVGACAFSPQGDRVVAGSGDTTLRLWEVSTGASGDLASYAVLRGHKQAVWACAFSPKGDRVVSGGSYDNVLLLWAITGQSGDNVASYTMLQGHTGAVTACAFSPKGDRVVSGSDDHTLRLWVVGEVMRKRKKKFSVQAGKALHPVGRALHLLSKLSSQVALQGVLRGHEKGVTACAFSPEGDRVVSSSLDGTLRLWLVGRDAAGELTSCAVLREHTGGVTTCAFSPQGDRVVSGSHDQTLRVWDVSDVHHTTCVQVVKWYSSITTLSTCLRRDRYTMALSSEVCSPLAVQVEGSAPLQIVVVGDSAGLVSLWQFEGQQLRLRDMPPQPGMAKINWRETWQTVKLTGAQVTSLARALLGQYREKPLEEGTQENQVQLVTYSPEEEVKKALDLRLEKSKEETIAIRDVPRVSVPAAFVGAGTPGTLFNQRRPSLAAAENRDPAPVLPISKTLSNGSGQG